MKIYQLTNTEKCIAFDRAYVLMVQVKFID